MCQFITVSRTVQNTEFVYVCERERDRVSKDPVCVCARVHPLNLSLLPLRTKMYVRLMNHEHLALLGCCVHVLKHTHLRREYKRTTTNFLAYLKMAGQRGFSDNSRTRRRKIFCQAWRSHSRQPYSMD